MSKTINAYRIKKIENYRKMTQKVQEEIVAAMKAVEQRLEALRSEHTSLSHGLQEDPDPVISERARSLQQSIELGLGVVQVAMDLASHLQLVEAEMQKLRTQVKGLCQELASTQQLLQSSQQREKEYVEFIKTSRNIIWGSADNSSMGEQTKNEKSVPVVDLLPDDDADDRHNMSPTPQKQLQHSQQVNVGYEIPARLLTIHNLVNRFASQGRYDAVIPLCKQALKDLEKTSGHDHPDVATMLNILAMVYFDLKKYEEAENLLNDALAIRKKTLGENHPAVAATLDNLVVLYEKIGKYKEADPLCKRNLDIREKEIAWLREELASYQQLLQYSQEKVAELKEENQNLKFMNSTRKYDQSSVDDSMMGEQSKYEKSDLFVDLFSDDDRHDTSPTPQNQLQLSQEVNADYEIPARLRPLHSLVIQFASEGRYDAVIPLCKQALELQKTSGHDHQDVATMPNIENHPAVDATLDNWIKDHYERVEKFYQRVLEFYEKHSCSDDPNYSLTMNHVASCYLRQGKHKEAEVVYKQILNRAHEREVGTIDGENKSIWQVAEEREENKAKNKEHIPYGQYGGWHKATKVDSPIVTTTLNNLGALYRRQGKYEAAKTLEDCALRSREEALDIDTEICKPMTNEKKGKNQKIKILEEVQENIYEELNNNKTIQN